MFWKRKRRKPVPVAVDIVKTLDIETPFMEIWEDLPEPYMPPGPKQLADTAAFQREIEALNKLGAPKLDKIHEVPVGVLLNQVDVMEKTKMTPEDRDMPVPCKVCADTKAQMYYVLYDDDGELTAVGPFLLKDNARCWAAGMAHLTEDTDYRVLGVVSDLINFGSLNIIAPVLGK